MSIVLVGSTSGSCTLQEQAVAGNTTLTLPTVSGTILTTGSSGQIIPKAALPTGSVLQVVSTVNTTQYTTTSTTFVASGLSASITPTSSTSKILILATIGVGQGVSSNDAGGAVALYRGTTSLQSPTNFQFYIVGSTATSPRWVASINYLDSPATTSSVTYNIYFASYLGSQTWRLNENSPTTITFMEIAA